MQVCTGKSVLMGIAIGRLAFYQRGKKGMPEKTHVAEAEAEVRRFERARRQAVGELEALYEQALREAGKERALIFDMHKLLLEGGDYPENVARCIRQEKVSAAYAAGAVGEMFAARFASMEDEYMRARSADVRDIADRVIRLLDAACPKPEKPRTGPGAGQPVILLAEDLSPSEVMELDRSRVLALVLRQGSVNSHTAILIGAMNIPALVQTDVPFDPAYEGVQAVVDGIGGQLILEPDGAALADMAEKKRRFEQEREKLAALVGLDNVTAGGRRINVHANVGSLAEVDMALRNDAGGIGLFRSEFLYLGRSSSPDEEEQYRIYRDAILKMAGRRVVIRTLDLGADKRAGYLDLPEEENPAMGFRAIRVSLGRQELFLPQLRAVCRAAAWGKAAVLFPMIISVDELRQCRALLERARAGLQEEGIPVGPVEIGVMVETPAAVMISRELAREADFLSIGTNDLTQYALALDRQNPSLEGLYDPHHPAVLSMIRMTVENGHAEGVWVGICGELAGDTSMTEFFLDLGVDELSVAPSRILQLRGVIRGLGR